MKPFFSIIIPTLNEENYISRILTDISNQSKRNYEVIVVDGRSKDKTKQIIRSFENKINLRLLEIDKPNLSRQKNIGGKEATGEYLVFFDADMSIRSSFISIAERLIKKNKGLIFLPYVYPEEKKEFSEINFVFPIINISVELSQTINKPFSSGPSMIWEKNTFNFIGGFDDLFGEDHHIIRKAHHWGIRAKCLPSLKVNFSLRRMKKQGRLDLIYHFIRSHIYLLFNDKLKERLFKYEMGGHLYEAGILKKKNKNILDQLNSKKIIKQIKKSLQSLMNEV